MKETTSISDKGASRGEDLDFKTEASKPPAIRQFMNETTSISDRVGEF